MIKKHIHSYKYALRGIWLAFRYEANMAFHLAGAMVVLILNYTLEISRTDWIITLMLIGVVWMAEIFNTAIEKLADRVTKEHDPLIAHAKDLAAGAVLIICIIAAVSGVIIYYPYLF
ncbi:MAG TPA: diacylglycerol kinase family protein [Chryseosolibacter sp.]